MKINYMVWGLIIFLSVVLFGESQEQVPTISYVETIETQFVLNGSTFVFNGFNSYWMMSVAVDQTQRFKVSNVFAEAKAAGLGVCRTWAFNDDTHNPFALQIYPGVYNENTFQALDFVISEARKYNIRLILPLVNNYQDYGGRPQYVKWAKSAGVKVTSDDDFYTNAVIRGYYKNHVKAVLTRMNTITKVAYKDDPIIMAWELMNEPRCYDTGKILNGWIQEMASYVKSIDNKHLLGLGMEGFYGYQIPERIQYNPGNYTVGTDFISNHLIKEIDFTSIHAYPDAWLAGESDKSQIEYMKRWLMVHWNDSKTILKKPLILGEFGRSTKINGTSIRGRDSYLGAVYMYIHSLAGDGTMGGGLVWQIMGDEMEGYYDGYEIVIPQNPSTTKLIYLQSKLMTALEHPLK